MDVQQCSDMRRTYRQKISEGRTDRRTEMNLSFLAKNGCFNMQFMINSSSGLQKEGNTTSVFEETHFQFLWLIYFAYVIIFLASLFGNSVIIRIIRTDNSMKITTNYLIVNQACADLVITIAQLTNAIHYSSTDGLWLEGLPGLITCKIFQAILFTPPSFSVWILVSIAVDRFYAVTRPLKLSPVSQHLKKMILFFWLWSFAFSANFLLNETFKKINESYYCDATNILSEWAVFNIVTLTLNVFLPISIISIMYTIVCLKLWSREVPGEGTNQIDAVKAARKVTRMMIIIVVLYVLCWLPMFISVLLHIIGYVQLKHSLLLFILWLTLCYSGINPYVYLIFSQKFRNGFKNLFRNFLGKIKIRNINVFSFRSQSVELEQI